jgi:hypothetical protein
LAKLVQNATLMKNVILEFVNLEFAQWLKLTMKPVWLMLIVIKIACVFKIRNIIIV